MKYDVGRDSPAVQVVAGWLIPSDIDGLWA